MTTEPDGLPAADAVSIMRKRCVAAELVAGVFDDAVSEHQDVGAAVNGFVDAGFGVVQTVEKHGRGHAVIDGADQAGVGFFLNQAIQTNGLACGITHV